MYYLYTKESIPKKPKGLYYTAEDLKDLHLEEYEPDEDDEDTDESMIFMDMDESFCPVHELDDYTWKPCNCIDEEDARTKVMNMLNKAIFDEMHNL